MADLTKFLSSNPFVLNTALMFCILIILVLLIIFLLAFFQGREVSFWPPKIGSKPSKTLGNNETEKKLGKNDNKEKKESIKTGKWLSVFSKNTEVNDIDWVAEEIEIIDHTDSIELKSLKNDLGFKWEGKAQIVNQRYVYGNICSVKPGANSNTSFILILGQQGNYLYGKWMTPNEKNEILVGYWLLGENEAAIEQAKKVALS